MDTIKLTKRENCSGYGQNLGGSEEGWTKDRTSLKGSEKVIKCKN